MTCIEGLSNSPFVHFSISRIDLDDNSPLWTLLKPTLPFPFSSSSRSGFGSAWVGRKRPKSAHKRDKQAPSARLVAAIKLACSLLASRRLERKRKRKRNGNRTRTGEKTSGSPLSVSTRTATIWWYEKVVETSRVSPLSSPRRWVL